MTLAVLVVARGRVVSVDRLVEAVWEGGAGPANASRSVPVLVHRLRKVLGAGAIVREAPGYRLAVQTDAVDVWRVEALAAHARSAMAVGDRDTAAAGFAAALGGWRGDPYEGLGAYGAIADERARLAELRVTLLENAIGVDLDRGRHRERLGELTSMVAEFPLREKLRGCLMVALYRSGRAADALAVYQEGSALLVERTGLEPGPDLRDLAHAIENRDPGLDRRRGDPAAGTARQAEAVEAPAELPVEPGTFTGRGGDVQTLAAQLVGGASIALYGPAGAGKSTLALHLAHQVRDRFPDGQVYVNLYGATPGISAVEPDEGLARLLRSLGVEVPQDPAEAAARYRTITAERRVLVVLDDAADPAQVRDLLPGSNGASAVIVSSRQMLSTLDIAVHHRVEGLAEADSIELLTKLAGAERATADPGSAARIAAACAHLPLALRIAGARLVTRPHWGLAWLADRLTAEHGRLDELEHDDLAVRASLAVGLESLEDDDAFVFALLGIVQIPSFHLRLAAALLDREQRPTRRALDRLVQAQLLTPIDEDHYSFHDLTRLYAQERAAALEPGTRQFVFARAVHWYLATARQAVEITNPATPEHIRIDGSEPAIAAVRPILRTNEEVMAWVDAEKDNLAALTDQALRDPDPARLRTHALELCALTLALYNPFYTRGRLGEYRRFAEPVADFAADAGLDAYPLGRVQLAVGGACSQLADLVQADRLLEAAFENLRRADRPDRQVNALNSLAINAMRQGRTTDGLAYFSRALELIPDDQSVAARSLRLNIADAHHDLGDLDTAIGEYATAVELAVRFDDPTGEAVARTSKAQAHRAMGDPRSALEEATAALTCARQVGALRHQADALWVLADAHADLGDDPSARAHWRDALAIHEELGLVDPAHARELLTRPRPTNPVAE